MTHDILNIIERIRRDKYELGITLYDGASLTDITKFEKTKQIQLPDDFKKLYQFCNGFESAEDLFRIIPLQEIIDNKDDKHLVERNDFHFAEYMIYCDTWTLSVNEHNSNDYSIYNKTENVITLTLSFTEFLDVFLTSGVFDGLYNWRKRIEETTY